MPSQVYKLTIRVRDIVSNSRIRTKQATVLSSYSFQFYAKTTIIKDHIYKGWIITDIFAFYMWSKCNVSAVERKHQMRDSCCLNLTVDWCSSHRLRAASDPTLCPFLRQSYQQSNSNKCNIKATIYTTNETQGNFSIGHSPLICSTKSYLKRCLVRTALDQCQWRKFDECRQSCSELCSPHGTFVQWILSTLHSFHFL